MVLNATSVGVGEKTDLSCVCIVETVFLTLFGPRKPFGLYC